MNVRRTIMNVTKEFKEFREDTKKQFSEIKEKVLKENKHPSDAQENINKWLVEMTKTIQDLRMKFNQEINTVKSSQSEMRMEVKTP